MQEKKKVAVSKASQIPVGTQFSPNLIDLKEFLQVLVRDSGYKDRMVRAVWQSPVNIRKGAHVTKSSRNLSLPVEAARQYGLLDGEYNATELTSRLSELNGPSLYEEFARHILVELGGLRVVDTIQQMKADNLNVTGDSLAEYLTDQGFNITIHNTAINSMRLWLAQAGLFPVKGAHLWEVDLSQKERILGLDDTGIAELIGLNDDQRAFVLALCRVDADGEYLASEIREMAETIRGSRLPRGNLAKSILGPLSDIGLVTYQSGGTQGGKSANLTMTPKFRAEVYGPLLEKAISSLDATLASYYSWTADEIFAGLESSNTRVKGEALEALAIFVMRLMGLRFVAWRKRAREETGRAEIDVVMAGVIGGLPTRWQIQCKNTPTKKVSLEDVAKEVGLTPLTKATHIMVLANADFTSDAKIYADELMRNSALSIILMDKNDLQAIRKSPSSIAGIIGAKARLAEVISRHGLEWLR